MNSDCPRIKTCINQNCVDPCPGTCGRDARCDVVNHVPMCSCPPGYTGNPFLLCRPFIPDGEFPNISCILDYFSSIFILIVVIAINVAHTKFQSRFTCRYHQATLHPFALWTKQRLQSGERSRCLFVPAWFSRQPTRLQARMRCQRGLSIDTSVSE